LTTGSLYACAATAIRARASYQPGHLTQPQSRA
jgi:hypothetical protein